MTAVAAAPPAEPSTGHILVVDDNEMNRDLLSRRLRRDGHTVVMAEHGRAALEALAREPPRQHVAVHLVVVDDEDAGGRAHAAPVSSEASRRFR